MTEKNVLHPLSMLQKYFLNRALLDESDGDSSGRVVHQSPLKKLAQNSKFAGNDPVADGAELVWKINELIHDLKHFPVPQNLPDDGYKTLADSINDVLEGMRQIRCDAHTYNANMLDAVAEMSFAEPEDEEEEGGEEEGDDERELVEAGAGEASEFTD